MQTIHDVKLQVASFRECCCEERRYLNPDKVGNYKELTESTGFHPNRRANQIIIVAN